MEEIKKLFEEELKEITVQDLEFIKNVDFTLAAGACVQWFSCQDKNLRFL